MTRGRRAPRGGPTQLTAAQRDAIAKAIKSAKVDVWTGAKDHTLRKVA